MQKLILLLWLLLAGQAFAQQSITTSYWQLGDTTPLTTVWDTFAGQTVATTTPAYLAWLRTQAATGGPTAVPICGVNNNAGAIQIKVCTPVLIGGWFNGQIKTVLDVLGATAANGTWTIRVDDFANGLVTLLTSTYGAAWTSGGLIGSAPVIDTNRSWMAQINKYNQYQYYTGQTFAPAPPIPLSGALVSLVNPIAPAYQVQMSGGEIVLPQANVPGSPPIGMPIMFQNTSMAFAIYAVDGTTILANVTSNHHALVMLQDNPNKNGNWTVITSTP